jgi:hypothetical protein
MWRTSSAPTSSLHVVFEVGGSEIDAVARESVKSVRMLLQTDTRRAPRMSL